MPSSFPVMGHVMGHPQCSACPCTWRSTAQTPHRAFIAATHRGTAPAQALTSAGSIGCSRQAGPPALYQHASPKTGTGIHGWAGRQASPWTPDRARFARLSGVTVGEYGAAGAITADAV